jgi:uncharacterized membrane protein (DUF2068 family)
MQARQPTQRVQRRHARVATQRRMAAPSSVAALPATATEAAVSTLPATTADPAVSALPATATEPAVSALPATATEPAVRALPATATDPAVRTLPATAAEPVVIALPATATLSEVRTSPAALMVSPVTVAPAYAPGSPRCYRAPLMGEVVAWWRWEASREIELTPFIRFIIIERFVKGTALILAGVTLAVLGSDARFQSWTQNLQDQLNLTNSASLFKRAVEQLLVKFGTASARERDLISVGAVLYGLLEAFEGFGLVRRRRWAEYLVLVATSAFLPLEIDELVRKPTVLKALTFVVNLAIIGYLVWRKRLFLERPGAPEPQPA